MSREIQEISFDDIEFDKDEYLLNLVRGYESIWNKWVRGYHEHDKTNAFRDISIITKESGIFSDSIRRICQMQDMEF